MTQSLGVLAEAYPSQPNQLRGAMIGAVTELLARRGDQVDRARLVKVLTERDADELAVAATAAKQLLNCSTTEARVEALKRDYAKGLPDTRCPSAVRISEVAATRPEEPANAFISPPSKLRLMAGR